MKRHQTRGMSRRDFLGTGAKIGAGLALASAGLDLTANKSEAAGGITLNYMGLGNNPAPFAHGQQKPWPSTPRLIPTSRSSTLRRPPRRRTRTMTSSSPCSPPTTGASTSSTRTSSGKRSGRPPAGRCRSTASSRPRSGRTTPRAMIQADTVNGHIYAMPWMFDCGHLFYRKDILDAERAQAGPNLAGAARPGRRCSRRSTPR